MSEPSKDTIYIDVDDEITGIIDKVRSSHEKIVALVLPKRAAVFHSIVNLKLLKRSADEAKKNLVLITSEAGLMPLAGVVGLFTAKTLQSKPVVPPAPIAEEVEAIDNADDDVALDKTAPVGVLAGLPDEDEAIEVDNADKALPAAAVPNKARNKKLRIPNFEKFRTRVFLGIGLLALLIIGWVLAAMILPKAKITIKTNNTTINSNIAFTASQKAKELNKDAKIVPAEVKSYSKTDALQVPATGQQDQGTKASGNVTFSLSDCSVDQVTVPANTTITSNNLAFITQSTVSLSSVKVGNQCKNSDFKAFSTGTTQAAAQNPGDQYNLSARNYTVSNYGNVSAYGSAMSGGTSKIIKIVSQQDVDAAKQKIIDQNSQSGKDELDKQLKSDGYLPIADSFAVAKPVVTTTPNVGDPADQVSVSVTANATMLGAQQDGVKQLLENDIKQHIDTSKQNILDNGLSQAVFQIAEKLPNGDIKVSLQDQATAGVQQDADSIKRSVAGKKNRETHDIIGQRPGVKDVDVKYSPFWVSSTPKKLNKITVIFESSGNANNKP